MNYQSSNNYNTINHSSAKDILYELKQYELFSTNHPPQPLQQQQQHQQHVRSYSNGTNYSQNILNYNNSYYKINNINNYNYIKSSKSPTTYRSTDDVDVDNRKWMNSYYYNSSGDKMEHTEDIMAVERSHLVKEREANNGHNVTIHNFSTGNGHTVHVPTNTVTHDDDDHHLGQKRHTGNPFQPSQHFTQVSFHLIYYGDVNIKVYHFYLIHTYKYCN